MRLLIRRAVRTDDVGEFDPGPAVDGEADRGGRRAHGSAQTAAGSGRSSGDGVARMRPWLRWKYRRVELM